MSHAFTNFVNRMAAIAGHTGITVLMVLLLVAWGIASYLMGSPDTWWGTGTATNVVACVMMFVIRDRQRRNVSAMHRRLDELLHVVHDLQRHTSVTSSASPPLHEPEAILAGATNVVNMMAFRQVGERPRHAWLVPAQGRDERAEPTPLRRTQHKAVARMTETSTWDD